MALDPETILVSWLPSLVSNGREVFYEVHYRVDQFVSGKVLFSLARYVTAFNNPTMSLAVELFLTLQKLHE